MSRPDKRRQMTLKLKRLLHTKRHTWRMFRKFYHAKKRLSLVKRIFLVEYVFDKDASRRRV